MQYSWRLATATSNPLLAVAFPVTDEAMSCLPISSSANDPEIKIVDEFLRYYNLDFVFLLWEVPIFANNLDISKLCNLMVVPERITETKLEPRADYCWNI